VIAAARQHKWGLAAGVAFVFLIVAAAALGIYSLLSRSRGTAWWVLRTGPESMARAPVRDDSVRRVLAVFPFENISADRSQDYFSAGITEEISGQLSKLASLQVLSRIAIARYKDPRTNLRQMAAELGLGSVVVGSVRQVGSSVRIHVELVDPRNDRTVWSEQYDRELKDIFAVQSDVALRIADALEALPGIQFVARAGNGIIHYRGGAALPQGERPLALMQRIKEAYDPKHVLPDFRQG